MDMKWNLSESILFADSRDLMDLNSENSPNKRESGDDWTAEVIAIADVKEFIRRLKEIDFNSGYIDSNELHDRWNKEVIELIDKLAGEKLK